MSFYILVPCKAAPTAFELAGDDAASEIETLRRLHSADAFGAHPAKSEIEDQITKLRALYSLMQDADALDDVGMAKQAAR